jgi:negative regulator of sigma-B (phosphoserine phosphatase)
VALVERHDGEYLLAVADGLGHGEHAAAAADVAARTVRANSAEPLDNLLVLCHQALQDTRGAAMTMARVSMTRGALSWVGVGNVDAFRVHRVHGGLPTVEGPVLSGGIVGFNLPRVTVRTVDLQVGDLLIFVTDGVDPRFIDDLPMRGDPGELTQHIMRSWVKRTDDALVLVARYWGGDD